MDKLSGLRALVTSGPTRERIDPVRYLTNDSSGKQGHAIALALAKAGAEVTLVSGPVAIEDPEGVQVIKVESASDMLNACLASLPVDIAICAAAVADYRPATLLSEKLKKGAEENLTLQLVKNPDILATLSNHALRPKLVIGFAAETGNLHAHAREKLARKGCDAILANDVSLGSGVFGGEHNTVLWLTNTEISAWPFMSKQQVAEHLVSQIRRLL
jgi:phosphopantothenoylcysteine decarboxylase/phosphopantothenate--cysteine ligase